MITEDSLTPRARRRRFRIRQTIATFTAVLIVSVTGCSRSSAPPPGNGGLVTPKLLVSTGLAVTTGASSLGPDQNANNSSSTRPKSAPRPNSISESSPANTSLCQHPTERLVPFGVPFTGPSAHAYPTTITSGGRVYPIAREYFGGGVPGRGVLCRTSDDGLPPAIVSALSPMEGPLSYFRTIEGSGLRPWGAFGPEIAYVVVSVKSMGSNNIRVSDVFSHPGQKTPSGIATSVGETADAGSGWIIFNTHQAYPGPAKYRVTVSVYSVSSAKPVIEEQDLSAG